MSPDIEWGMRRRTSGFAKSRALAIVGASVTRSLRMEESTLGNTGWQASVRRETITPLRNASFTKGGTARVRRQGGNPRREDGMLVFDGSTDGNRQVDPQIAVGGGHVVHATNSGVVIYDKSGRWIAGVPQSEFNGGIDPKLFFTPHQRVFAFDLWNPWDKEEKKPVNISVSESSDPMAAWNTYPIPAPKGVDGGGIGYSRRWIGYSFPGGPERSFVLSIDDARKGKPVDVFHFAGHLGHPVFTQDRIDDLWFVDLTERDIVLTRVGEGRGGPEVKDRVRAPHGFAHFGWPPPSPQRGSSQRTASGDRNPKSLTIQGGFLWFSHTVDIDGRAGVQWHQFRLDGRKVQSGTIADPVDSFIQTTLGVNKRGDVLVGFQRSGPSTPISPRCALRRASDKPGTLRGELSLGQGDAPTDGLSWGDYSSTTVDHDNGIDLWTIQSVTNRAGKGETRIACVTGDHSGKPAA